MLMAAGLDQANAQVAADPANLAALGQILGVTTQGLIDVLKARSAVKNQFRVPMTQMRPMENNALKSSVNAVEALTYLFINKNPAYLGPAESFAERRLPGSRIRNDCSYICRVCPGSEVGRNRELFHRTGEQDHARRHELASGFGRYQNRRLHVPRSRVDRDRHETLSHTGREI